MINMHSSEVIYNLSTAYVLSYKFQALLLQFINAYNLTKFHPNRRKFNAITNQAKCGPSNRNVTYFIKIFDSSRDLLQLHVFFCTCMNLTMHVLGYYILPTRSMFLMNILANWGRQFNAYSLLSNIN